MHIIAAKSMVISYSRGTAMCDPGRSGHRCLSPHTSSWVIMTAEIAIVVDKIGFPATSKNLTLSPSANRACRIGPNFM